MLAACSPGTSDKPIEQRPTIVAPCTLPSAQKPAMSTATFHVSPGDAIVIPAAQIGYALRSDGIGNYHLSWTDTSNGATCFTGLVTGSADFDGSSISGRSGYELFNLVASDQIAIASVPGDNVDGLDFYSTMDPVTLDVHAASVPASIYYVDDKTRATSGVIDDPARFACP